MENKKNDNYILLDVDTGHDDAVAICVALALKRFELIGITTVAGNQTVDKTTVNTLKILTLTEGTHVPVAKGCHKPLIRPLETAEEIHGETGLDGADLPQPVVQALEKHAVDFLREVLLGVNEPATIVATAPLTNLAILLLVAPEVTTKIKRIIFMGGAINKGSRTQVAESNVYVDPEAAKIVINSGIPITMITLDITEQTAITLSELRNLLGKGNISKIFIDLLTFYAQKRYEVRGVPNVAIHDAVAAAVSIEPTLIKTQLLPVDVETEGHLTRGMTVVDRRPRTAAPSNVDVAVDIDVKLFKEILRESFRILNTKNKTLLFNTSQSNPFNKISLQQHKNNQNWENPNYTGRK